MTALPAFVRIGSKAYHIQPYGDKVHKLSGHPETLGGSELRRAFEAAIRCFERYREDMNALNVFPVPDGDTGTNMLLTMRQAADEGNADSALTAGNVLGHIARGAFLGARGNSGVILSQFLKGLADGSRDKQHMTAGDVVASLQEASEAAYASMSKPVEGTMLTVARECAEAGLQALHSNGSQPLAVLEAASAGARESLANTPALLPVLREAGVVDAGGQGIVLLMEAMTASLAGQDVDSMEFEICRPADGTLDGAITIHGDYLDAAEQEEYGYCIQFMLEGEDLPLKDLREWCAGVGNSVGVIGDDSLARVHLHAPDPEVVLAHAGTIGTVSGVRVDDMDLQREGFVAHHRGELDDVGQAIVAVVQGEGFANLFRELGCRAVVPGGQSMNPSTQQLLHAVQWLGDNVVLLPNNGNVVATANQAAQAQGSGLHVVPSKTLAQGISAMLAFNDAEPLESNLEAMNEALGVVVTVEVTQAVRSTSVSGVPVEVGQYIALRDDELVAVGAAPNAVLLEALTAEDISGFHVTLYWGASLQEADATEAASLLMAGGRDVEVEVHHGGQPFYQYIASVE